MMLQTIVILCCVFLQHVTAEYRGSGQPTIWDLFNWEITVQRQQQDEITLRGLAGRSVKENDVKISGAVCNEAQKWTGRARLPGFVIQCKCHFTSSTFVPENMGCITNSRLKQGIHVIAKCILRYSTAQNFKMISLFVLKTFAQQFSFRINVISSTQALRKQRYNAVSVRLFVKWKTVFNLRLFTCRCIVLVYTNEQLWSQTGYSYQSMF